MTREKNEKIVVAKKPKKIFITPMITTTNPQHSAEELRRYYKEL